MQTSVARSALHVAVDKENSAGAKRAQAPTARRVLGDISKGAKPIEAAPKAQATSRPKRTRAKGIAIDLNADIEYAPPSKATKKIPYRPAADLDFPLEELLRPRAPISILADKELDIKPEFAAEESETPSIDLPVADLDSLIPAMPDVILPED